jgi:hypothetical protein
MEYYNGLQGKKGLRPDVGCIGKWLNVQRLPAVVFEHPKGVFLSFRHR